MPQPEALTRRRRARHPPGRQRLDEEDDPETERDDPTFAADEASKGI